MVSSPIIVLSSEDRGEGALSQFRSRCSPPTTLRTFEAESAVIRRKGKSIDETQASNRPMADRIAHSIAVPSAAEPHRPNPAATPSAAAHRPAKMLRVFKEDV